MTDDQLEEWAKLFRARYKRELEAKIRRQFKVITKEASRIFRNLNIEEGEYNTRLHRIQASISYLRKCLHSIKEDDNQWYYAYVKVCIAEMYEIVDYPNENAWNEFFEKHRQDRDRILSKVRANLLQRLAKY